MRKKEKEKNKKTKKRCIVDMQTKQKWMKDDWQNQDHLNCLNDVIRDETSIKFGQLMKSENIQICLNVINNKK